MGCKPVKKAVKFIWKGVKPAVLRAGVSIVDSLDDVAEDIMTGDMKLLVAGKVIKKAADAAGQEMRESLARTVAQGLVALKRMGEEALVAEMGTLPDSEDDDLPEIAA